MSRLSGLPAIGFLAAFGLLAVVPAMAEESCPAAGPAMSIETITKSLQDRGYTQIRSLSLHHGCYEAKGIDSNGRRFEIEVSAADGKIVNEE